MPLIKNAQFIEDTWLRLDDEAPLPEHGDVILSPERLAALHDELPGRQGRIGVALPNTADPRALADLLPLLDLVVLTFPAFTDGRAYSQAWLLRNELGFRGELRATGNVLADQAAFMRRCGFDTFETDGRQPIEVWRHALNAVTLAYQRNYRGEGMQTRVGRPAPRARASTPAYPEARRYAAAAAS